MIMAEKPSGQTNMLHNKFIGPARAFSIAPAPTIGKSAQIE
jgi:hypothetical protein